MPPLPRSLTTGLGLIFALTLAARASAAPTAPGASPGDEPEHLDRHHGPSVSFDEVLGATDEAPALVELREAVDQKREADDALPRLSQNPRLQVMPGGRLPGAEEPGFELQVTISQGWNLEGYGRKRAEASKAETEVLDAHARALALEHQLGAAHAWIRLHGAERRLALAEQALANDRALVEALEQAVAEGVATRVDLAEVRALEAETRSVVIDLAGEVHDLGLALASQTGVRASVPLQTRGDYPAPQLPSEDELRRIFAELDALPEVTLRKLEARAALARAHESEAQRGTQLTTGASMQLESNGDVLVFGLVGVNIPVVDRNQRPRAKAEAEASHAEVEAERRAVELSAHLQVVIHDLHHTQERVTTLREQTLPAFDELASARAAALELGEGTRRATFEAEHQRNDAARELAAAESDWVWARVEAWLYLEAITSAQG